MMAIPAAVRSPTRITVTPVGAAQAARVGAGQFRSSPDVPVPWLPGL
jgi:hypothetical protein